MNALPSTPCYLNGEYIPISEAKISVLDRGFIFGDGIYEVVPVYGGKPFQFDQHMWRLDRSLKELRIINPHDKNSWLIIIQTLVEKFAEMQGQLIQDTNQVFYLQITRGVALRDHVMPTNIVPTIFAMVNTLIPPPEVYRIKGVSCVTADDFRWEKAHIKTTSLLGAVLSRQISADVNAAETVMFRENFLSEAAASNVWVVKNGILAGPPKNNLVLEGIRYGLIENICKKIHIPFELRPITREDVFDADELLLSSATKEVLAITTLDGQAIGTNDYKGAPGPIYKKLYQAYQVEKNNE